VRVALFITCFNDTLFPGVGKAVVTVLERLGCEVDFPLEQTCCGQMHLNTGYRPEAARLAERFTEIFSPYDAVVTPSGSCAGTVREGYPHLLGREGPPVHEFTEFLVDVLGVTDVGAHYPHKVTYHPTCHSLRALKVGDRPYRLLQEVRGIDLVPLLGSAECCGFGGTFSVKNPDVSAAMLSDKMKSVLNTGAEVVTAVDTSCLMHIGGGLTHQRAGVRTAHLAEILASTA